MPRKPTTPGQERIIEQALLLLKSDGFAGFNMRKLSQSLGMTSGAAYRHFGGKEKILEIAADRILADIPIDEGQEDWRKAFVEHARAYRKVFQDYPGVGAYLTLHLGETELRQAAIARGIAVYMKAGLSKADSLRTAAILNAFLSASAGSGIAPPSAKAGRPSGGSDPDRIRPLDERSFEFGLQLLMAGIERHVEISRGQATALS